MAAAAAAAANQQGAAAAALHEGHVEQQQQHTHTTEQQADLPGKAQQSPVAPGEGPSRFLLPPCMLLHMPAAASCLWSATGSGSISFHNLCMLSAAGGGAVVCDLFKSHFSSLQQAMRAHKPLDATEEDDSGVQQDRRRSLSAK